MSKKLKAMKKKAWSEFSKYTRLRYADSNGMCRCVTCGVSKHWKEQQAGHFIDGRTNSILFDERGVWVQCYGCNMCRSGNKVEYFRFMQETVGDEVIDELRSLKKKTVKYSYSDYDEIRLKYKQKVKELEESQ